MVCSLAQRKQTIGQARARLPSHLLHHVHVTGMPRLRPTTGMEVETLTQSGPSCAQPSYRESHRVWDVDGWITMAEAGRRGAAEYGKLSVEQCLQLSRIMRA